MAGNDQRHRICCLDPLEQAALMVVEMGVGRELRGAVYNLDLKDPTNTHKLDRLLHFR